MTETSISWSKPNITTTQNIIQRVHYPLRYQLAQPKRRQVKSQRRPPGETFFSPSAR